MEREREMETERDIEREQLEIGNHIVHIVQLKPYFLITCVNV